jgi:hypothetical protein
MTRTLPLLILAANAACAPLPALITDAQVHAVLPPVHHADGMVCAARLNGHVRAARAGQLTRGVVAAVGAAVGGTAFALRDEPAGAPLAAVAAAVGPLAELLLRLVADPADLLSRHARGLASWDAARADPDDGEHLVRCARDEAPPRSRLPMLGGVAP